MPFAKYPGLKMTPLKALKLCNLGGRLPFRVRTGSRAVNPLESLTPKVEPQETDLERRPGGE